MIEVDEEGTEASAATAVIMGIEESIGPPVIDFIADHPFIFFLRDLQTGLLLFQGRMMNPIGEKEPVNAPSTLPAPPAKTARGRRRTTGRTARREGGKKKLGSWRQGK